MLPPAWLRPEQLPGKCRGRHTGKAPVALAVVQVDEGLRLCRWGVLLYSCLHRFAGGRRRLFLGRRGAGLELEALSNGAAATAAVLVEDVEANGDKEHQALDELLVVGAQSQDGHAVVEDAHDEATDHGSGHRS